MIFRPSRNHFDPYDPLADPPDPDANIDALIFQYFKIYMKCYENSDMDLAYIYQSFIHDLFFLKMGQRQDEIPNAYLDMWRELGMMLNADENENIQYVYF